MCVFDITPESDFEVIKENALKETKQFLDITGRGLYREEFTHEWIDWNPGGFFKKKPITTFDLLLRSTYGEDKVYRVSRLSLSWNSKDNVVDVMVLDPKYPVLIEYLMASNTASFKYFRFVTRSPRSKIVFIKRNWKTDADLPCKNNKVTYIHNYEL